MAEDNEISEDLLDGIDLISTLENSTKAPEEEVEVVVLDHEGDVILQAGTKELHVSSKILTLASEFFKTMFKPNFREGSTPRSPANPLRVPLPDDDPEALHMILSIIHFSLTKDAKPKSIDHLLNAAILCDKYDMMKKMENHFLMWLPSFYGKDMGESTLWKLLRITLLMYHESEFAKVTKQLSLTLTNSTSKQASHLGIPRNVEGLSPMKHFD